MTPWQTTPLGPFGIRVDGMAAPRIADDAQAVATLRQLIDRHLVVVLSEQAIDPNQLVAFAATLGEVRPSRVPDASLPMPASRHLFVSASPTADGEWPKPGADAAHSWHADYCTQATLPALSMLHAVQMPAGGSVPSFADLHRVYDALPDELKAQIEPLSAWHYAHPNGVDVPLDGKDITLPWADRQRGVAHRLVMQRADGRRHLFLPARRDSAIVGLDEHDSRQLLDRLWSQVESDGAPWDFEQRTGDLLIWDNRAALHKRSAWPHHTRRLLWFLTTH